MLALAKVASRKRRKRDSNRQKNPSAREGGLPLGIGVIERSAPITSLTLDRSAAEVLVIEVQVGRSLRSAPEIIVIHSESLICAAALRPPCQSLNAKCKFESVVPTPSWGNARYSNSTTKPAAVVGSVSKISQNASHSCSLVSSTSGESPS